MLFRLGALRRVLAGLTCAAAFSWPLAVRADETADELARRHFDSGAAYLEESDYDNALKAFQKAYELSQRPEILLNIATVQERRGDLAAAISALEQYLAAAPNGDRADTTRLRIQNLQKRLAESPPPTPTASASVAPVPPPPPPPAAAPPPAPPRPAPNHVPAYIAFGVGGAGLVTAVVTGIMANAKYQDAKDSCSPHCTDAQLSSAKTLALVSTITTGVAVVGAGVGLTLFLTSSSGASATSSSSVRVAVGPRGPAATASFRF
jgi:tetratricopeptide (TPR) repeat protein